MEKLADYTSYSISFSKVHGYSTRSSKQTEFIPQPSSMMPRVKIKDTKKLKKIANEQGGDLFARSVDGIFVK